MVNDVLYAGLGREALGFGVYGVEMFVGNPRGAREYAPANVGAARVSFEPIGLNPANQPRPKRGGVELLKAQGFERAFIISTTACASASV